MQKAFLIKRKTLLQEGIKVKDSNPELIVPFANMQVATSTTDVNQSITLVDEQMLDRKVAASIAGSHRGIQGEVLLLDDAMLQALLTTFNAGQEIQIAFGGESITYGINQVNGVGTQKAEVGDIIIVKVEGKRDEEYAVNPNLHLEQLTYNNEDYEVIQNINSQIQSALDEITSIEDDVENLFTNKANVDDVYSKAETYSKIEINASQAGQDAKIEATRVKNVAQDGRLDALELKVNPMDARFTSIESKDVAQDGRLDAVEVQSSQAFAAASRFAAMEGSIVQSGDLSTDIKHIVDFPWTEEGTNVVATLDAASQVGLVANEKVTIETYRQSNDRWNDVSAKYKDGIQHDELYLETTIVPCDVQIIQDKVIVSGLNQQQRQTLIQNYRIKRIIQAGQQSVGTDDVARTAAATAQTQADTALAKANQALTKVDAIDLTPLTTGVANNKAEIDVIKPKVTALEAEMLLTQKSADANLQTTSKNVVGAINEINAGKANGNLKVMSENDTLVDLSTMDGSTSAKSLVTRNRVNEVVQFFTATKIKYYKGQITIFSEEKTAPSKFADTTLFDKEEQLGELKLTSGTPLSNYEIIRKYYNAGETVIFQSLQSGYVLKSSYVSKYGNDLYYNYELSGSGDKIGTMDVANYLVLAPTKKHTFKYIAKKDITYAEMGE